MLRLRDGDEIEAIDSAASRYIGRVRVDGNDLSATLIERLEDASTMPFRVTVAQGVPKAQKMDYVVEKLTELGAVEIVPLHSERTVSQASENKLERWRRLTKTAAAQSGRSVIPHIAEPVEFARLLTTFDRYDCVLFPWELADRIPLREQLPVLVNDARRILIVIGPEGGFSHDEAQAARDAGAHLLWLGLRILRTETAALVLISVLSYLSGV